MNEEVDSDATENSEDSRGVSEDAALWTKVEAVVEPSVDMSPVELAVRFISSVDVCDFTGPTVVVES